MDCLRTVPHGSHAKDTIDPMCAGCAWQAMKENRDSYREAFEKADKDLKQYTENGRDILYYQELLKESEKNRTELRLALKTTILNMALLFKGSDTEDYD